MRAGKGEEDVRRRDAVAKLTSRVNGGQNNLKDYPAYSNLPRADR